MTPATPTKRSTSQNTLIGCGAIFLWASSLPFGKRVSEDLGPITAISVIYFVNGILGLMYFRLTGRLRSVEFLRNWQFYARTALFMSYCVLLYFAIGTVSRTDMPLVTLLNYLWPTFTMLLSVALLHQRCRLGYLYLGSVIVVIGLGIEILGERVVEILTSQKDHMTLVALGSTLISAFLWGLYSVLSRRWGEKSGQAIAVPFVILFSSFGLIILRLFSNESSTITSGSVFPLLYLCITPIAANICWDIGTRLGNINILSLIADSLPWASLTVTQIYLGVPIGLTTWISAVVIVSGALISRYSLISVNKDEG